LSVNRFGKPSSPARSLDQIRIGQRMAGQGFEWVSGVVEAAADGEHRPTAKVDQ
jgi:hypothetical protein